MHRRRELRSLALSAMAFMAVGPFSHGFQTERGERVVRVRQDEEGDVRVTNRLELQEVLNGLGEEGGTVEIGPGRYVLHATVFVPAGITLRGTPGALFALPAPTRVTEDAPEGATRLALASTEDFAPRSLVQVLPPEETEFFADGETRDVRWAPVQAVEAGVITLAQPLPVAVPAGSRVGYSHKLFKTTAEGRVTFERLAFDGGRVDDIPMPGHHLRTAVWASAPFHYGERPTHPPCRDVVVRSCVFRNLYGRGVAYYHTVDSRVEASVFEHIADEAIDFDHFCARNVAVGNAVRDAWWGIVLNDVTDCDVAYNHVEDVRIGIWAWWWKDIPREGLNLRNTVRHNVVRRATEAAILFDRFCEENTIFENFVDGPVRIVEPNNTVEGNTAL